MESLTETKYSDNILKYIKEEFQRVSYSAANTYLRTFIPFLKAMDCFQDKQSHRRTIHADK